MTKSFVRVLVNLACSWTKAPPRYRVFVNGELFTERTWIWQDVSLEELLQINARPGEYEIKYELVKPHRAQLSVQNIRVEHGPATVKHNKLSVHHENT